MFNLKVRNGQLILTSEIYESKGAAEGGIASVKANAADDNRYERKVSKKGEPYFVLKAANGQVIGMSEMYSGNTVVENGIASVKAKAPGAEIEDNT
jgi:uncharacterized protein YegP (UPF0339 family)